MRDAFSDDLYRLARREPGPMRNVGVRALELWAVLAEARAEADAVRDDRLAFRLDMLERVLTLPDTAAA